LVGLTLIFKTKPHLLKIVLIGLGLSFGLTFFRQSLALNIAIISFGVLTIIFSVYCILQKKYLAFIIGLFGVLSFLWSFFNYEFSGFIQASMIIPVICYIVILTKLKKNISELSVLTILATFEMTEFINYLIKLNI
jgi:hypothetical protein